MTLSRESGHIVAKFKRYIQTGNKPIIEKFSREQIESAILQFAQDSHKEFYHAMQLRVIELKEIENRKRNFGEKWKDRAIGAVLTIIIGLLIKILWESIKPN